MATTMTATKMMATRTMATRTMVISIRPPIPAGTRVGQAIPIIIPRHHRVVTPVVRVAIPADQAAIPADQAAIPADREAVPVGPAVGRPDLVEIPAPQEATPADRAIPIIIPRHHRVVTPAVRVVTPAVRVVTPAVRVVTPAVRVVTPAVRVVTPAVRVGQVATQAVGPRVQVEIRAVRAGPRAGRVGQPAQVGPPAGIREMTTITARHPLPAQAATRAMRPPVIPAARAPTKMAAQEVKTIIPTRLLRRRRETPVDRRAVPVLAALPRVRATRLAIRALHQAGLKGLGRRH
jgi:hypothetical protein